MKNTQDKEYPAENLTPLMDSADIVIPCNINFASPLLKCAAKCRKTIATDLHVIGNTNDEYNLEFMEYPDIHFMRNEAIAAAEFF